MKRIILSGGGTGGHIYPAITIAKEISRIEEAEILFVGTPNGMESKIIPKEGYKFAEQQASLQYAATLGEEYIEDVNNGIDELVKQLGELAQKNIAKSDNILSGDMAEIWHADTFNINSIIKVNKGCSFLNIFHEVRSFLLYIFYFIYIIWIILIKIISVIVIFKFIIIFLNVVIYSYSHIYCIFLSYFLSPVVIAA